MFNITTGQFEESDELVRLKAEKKAGMELQSKKHKDWNENYELYRNKVRLNRLTQRQAVNIPLMKETVKTLLSKIDDPPEVDWKNLSGDEQKEIVYQELWNDFAKQNNIDVIDVIDKKNVLLYGASVKKLNIGKTGVSLDVLDPFDVLFDPLMVAWDLESARFIIQQNIFRSAREIIADKRYTKKGKDELKIWANSSAGITQSKENKEQWEKKMERLKAMGVDDSDFPYFAGGDRLVNLTEHYTRRWNGKEFEKRVICYAEGNIILLDEKLSDLLGTDFWPFIRWAEDPETNDIYCDSVADLIRVPNQVLNIWFSQLIENRTLRNFQMHWFLPGQNYTPQTYTPGPGVMLPAPPGDDINKVIKPVEVSGLDDTLAAIQAIINIAERGSGTTAIDKGQPEQGQQTLGEVQILVGKSNERAVGMTKFYRRAWYECAKKWGALMDENPPSSMKLYKTGRSGKMYSKTVLPSEWKGQYEPIVSSTSEQEIENTKGIQRFMFILSQFPNNSSLRKIAQKRMLELVDLTPEELREVLDFEEQAEKMAQENQDLQMQQAQQEIKTQEAQRVQQTADSGMMSDIQKSLSELQSV